MARLTGLCTHLRVCLVLQCLEGVLAALRLRLDRDPKVPPLFASLIYTSRAMPQVWRLVQQQRSCQWQP
jgi:hypothetical protein